MGAHLELKRRLDRTRRSHGAHLTPEQITALENMFLNGESAIEACQHIGCTRRAVQKHYAIFRAIHDKPRAPRTAQEMRRFRFYSSNFEL